MARIVLDNLGLSFDVRRHGRMTLKEFVLRGMFRRKVNPRITIEALTGVNLVANEGDRIGLIGHNGAGKSTLLKTIAGIYPPNQGRRQVEGRIGSLFDVMLGFEVDASGWENIAYRGYLQGETPKSIAAKTKAIAEFSELGEFLDMSVSYYSSGMSVRLGFAIATACSPEILVVDEILSAGDLAFQQKARVRMEEMITNANIVVLASHDLTSIGQICNHVLWMDHGRVKMQGPADEVISAYMANSHGAPHLAAA